MLGRTAGGLLRFLSAWEFESRVFPEIPKFGGFASPARYFYFTLSDFSNMRLLFLITLVFLLCVQKSRTSVRDFCLHLFCQCKLVEISGIEPLTSWMPFKRSPSWAIPLTSILALEKFLFSLILQRFICLSDEVVGVPWSPAYRVTRKTPLKYYMILEIIVSQKLCAIRYGCLLQPYRHHRTTCDDGGEILEFRGILKCICGQAETESP